MKNKISIFKPLSFLFIFLFIIGLFYLPSIQAQVNFLPLPSYNSLWSLWSPPISPVNPITSLPNPLGIGVAPLPFLSSLSRSAQVLGGGAAVAPPATITTSWSGSWYSLPNTNQFGLMNLTLTEDITAGTFDGTAWLVLNRYIPAPVAVSGAYTGVGTTFILSGIYTDFLIQGGLIFPIDYYITLECLITAGTTMTGSYSISTLLQQNDYGSFNLALL